MEENLASGVQGTRRVCLHGQVGGTLPHREHPLERCSSHWEFYLHDEDCSAVPEFLLRTLSLGLQCTPWVTQHPTNTANKHHIVEHISSISWILSSSQCVNNCTHIINLEENQYWTLICERRRQSSETQSLFQNTAKEIWPKNLLSTNCSNFIMLTECTMELRMCMSGMAWPWPCQWVFKFQHMVYEKHEFYLKRKS